MSSVQIFFLLKSNQPVPATLEPSRKMSEHMKNKRRQKHKENYNHILKRLEKLLDVFKKRQPRLRIQPWEGILALTRSFENPSNKDFQTERRFWVNEHFWYYKLQDILRLNIVFEHLKRNKHLKEYWRQFKASSAT